MRLKLALFISSESLTSCVDKGALQVYQLCGTWTVIWIWIWIRGDAPAGCTPGRKTTAVMPYYNPKVVQ
jgi:hypothetical protein